MYVIHILFKDKESTNITIAWCDTVLLYHLRKKANRKPQKDGLGFELKTTDLLSTLCMLYSRVQIVYAACRHLYTTDLLSMAQPNLYKYIVYTIK